MSVRKARQADRRGVWSALALVVQYPFIFLALLLSYFVFRVLNRTTVIGQRFAKLRPRTVVVSNHQSLLDSFLVGSVIGVPQLFWQPWLTPWHLADGQNFLGHPLLRYVYLFLRVIPVGRDERNQRRDTKAFYAASRAVQSGTLHVFAEGTRSTDGELRPLKRSAAGLILNAGAGMKFVYFTGMHQVQPYRKKPGDGPRTWLRAFGKRTEWLLHFRTGQRVIVNIGRDCSAGRGGRAGRGRQHAGTVRAAGAGHERTASLAQGGNDGCAQRSVAFGALRFSFLFFNKLIASSADTAVLRS